MTTTNRKRRVYDASYNYFTLERQLLRSDFLADPSLKTPEYRERVLQTSAALSNSENASFFGLKKGNIKGKDILRSTHISDDLIIRKTTQNLRRALTLSSPNRNNAVLNCAALLKETTPYLVYRIDIKSFYESFQNEHINQLLKEKVTSRTRLLTTDLVKHWHSVGGQGIPRGLPLSQTLSDLLMEDFDNALLKNDHVYFYTRYVDDIILFTKDDMPPRQFIPILKNSLPPGLSINKKKSHVRYAKPVKGNPRLRSPDAQKDFQIEYLGYSFDIETKAKNGRSCKLDIAPSKVKKRKTQIILAFRDFLKNNNFFLLKERLRYLTSNFSVYDVNHRTRRLAGIYYNYPLIDVERSNALKELDHFLKMALLSGGGQVLSEFQKVTNPAQREVLLSLSFTNGCRNRIFSHFSPSQLRQLQQCWHYVL